MDNFILKLRCKEHKKNKIIGRCNNSSCQKQPLFCADCLAQDHHSNHLEDVKNFGDLELLLQQIIYNWSMQDRNKSVENSKSEISEIQLEQEINQLNVINNPIQCKESNDLQPNLEKDQLQELNNQETISQESGQCHYYLELGQFENNEEERISKSCKGFKCSKCQQFFNYPMQKIESEIYCKECTKCVECSKQEPKSMSKSFFNQKDILEISQNSALKKEMIAYIKKYFGTKQKQGDKNDKIWTFYSESYLYINTKDYLGYVIGYNHPLVKSKISMDPKTIKITQEIADKFLIEDLDQFERELYEYYLTQNKKPEDIPENIRMLMLFILFIFKDFSCVLNLVNQQTYNKLYVETINCPYPKGVNVLKGKVEKALDFFNDHFHREDGSIRENTIKTSIKKYLPTFKR